ncbi:hypothetical protein DBR06_SOUSAS3310146, partial [Sousa chinensis]
DGPEIMGCKVCQFNWTEGKGVTLKSIKQQKCQGHGQVCAI